mgnify:FL=1
MALPELFFSPCQEPPYRISGSTRQFHWKGCLYGAHILGNGRCRSYTSTFHKSFPAQWAVAYLNDILSRETAIVVKHSHPQHSLPVYSHLNAAVFNGLVHWNKIICPRLTVWTSHRINLLYLSSSSRDTRGGISSYVSAVQFSLHNTYSPFVDSQPHLILNPQKIQAD